VRRGPRLGVERVGRALGRAWRRRRRGVRVEVRGEAVPQPRVVAVYDLNLESKGLKPVFHFIGSRVGTRRAFKLWVN
jgi:hypothetical protein